MAHRSRRVTRGREFLRTYTQDLTSDELHRLFTRDARDAYRFFARGIDENSLAGIPWHKRWAARLRLLFLAFALKLSPARRVMYAGALLLAALGLIELLVGVRIQRLPAGFFSLPVPFPVWRSGTGFLLLGFLLVNLLVFMEVADRLSLKNDLEVARDIQSAMLRHDTYRAAGVEAHGETRPANTVGGDFYEVLPLDDGRLVLALGDVAGKGSPAALLMALLLAILRTLVDERLDTAELVTRLNQQIARHAPPSRFITLFFAVYDPATGRLEYVNAGQNPPLLRRAASASFERLATGGIALGLDARALYRAAAATLASGDMLVLYSDGITEAESPQGIPFDETGLECAVEARADATAPDLCTWTLRAVAAHAQDTRFADDLTIVVLRRLPPLPAFVC
jgi:serine phosphatase RsbU (regulator of sigma subunit)